MSAPPAYFSPGRGAFPGGLLLVLDDAGDILRALDLDGIELAALAFDVPVERTLVDASHDRPAVVVETESSYLVIEMIDGELVAGTDPSLVNGGMLIIGEGDGGISTVTFYD